MKSFDAALLGIPELPNYLGLIQQELDKAVLSDNSYISEPTLRLASTPSKRIRPVLVIAAAVSQGGKITKSVVSACAAVELIHLASLVHDDIMDNAVTRWNAPTVHSKEGLNRAILVGDYLFAKASVVALKASPQVAEVVAKTITNLCDGQSREMADVYNTSRSISAYLEAVRGKTGSLIAAACQVGALCAELEKTKVDAFRSYGESFGMAFQLIDDVLDFLSSPELMGKPVGNDVAEGIYTMPVIFGLQSPDRKKLLHQLQIAKKMPFNARHILNDSGAIEQTIQEAKKYNQQAREAISGFASEQLQSLPDAYLNWALENLIP